MAPSNLGNHFDSSPQAEPQSSAHDALELQKTIVQSGQLAMLGVINFLMAVGALLVLQFIVVTAEPLPWEPTDSRWAAFFLSLLVTVVNLGVCLPIPTVQSLPQKLKVRRLSITAGMFILAFLLFCFL